MSRRFGPTAVEPATPLWWGGIGLRIITLLFALGALIVHEHDYRRPWLAWTVLGAMAAWTVLTSVVYSQEALAPAVGLVRGARPGGHLRPDAHLPVDPEPGPADRGRPADYDGLGGGCADRGRP